MVPGTNGWFGSTTEAFCTSGRLTGPQEAALSVLREAAPAPLDVLSAETEPLLHGDPTGGRPILGSIRDRLADAWGVAALPSNRPIWEPYGLTEGDFAAAHSALKDEIQIFGRSHTATLSPRPLAGGATPAFDRYAGTAGRPPERPDAYWALLGQIGESEAPIPPDRWIEWQAQNDDYFGGRAFSFARSGQPAGSMAEFVEHAYAWAGAIRRRPELGSYGSTVIDPLRHLLSGEDTRGRLMHCVNLAGTDAFHSIRVGGFDGSDRLALVRGEDLMECAVQGHVEGAPCPLPPELQIQVGVLPTANADFSVIRLNQQWAFDVGPYSTYAYANFSTARDIPPAALGRYYLIRPRLKGDTSPGPGEWELLLGTPLAANPNLQSQTQCHHVPIVPEAIEAAGAALAPSRDWCGSSTVSCAGTRFDERLPLEDELTGDGDEVESSWKHYLGLARAAADEADALGQEYIEASLRKDLRTEEVQIRREQQREKALAAFQRVQEICGSAVKPELLLRILGSDPNGDLDFSSIINADCLPVGTSPPICGSRRVLEDNPQFHELSACLGLFGNSIEAHLGDGSLCIANSGTAVPEGAPRVTTVSNCTSQECPEASGYRCLPPEAGLELFETKTLEGNPPLPDVCEGLQKLRASALAGGEAERTRILEAFKDTATLTADQIAGLPVRMKLDYNETAGTYVTVHAGPGGWGVSSKRPGSEPDPPGVESLCADADAECSDGVGGLFCKRWACSSPAKQAELNLRLYRAAVALMHAVPGAKPGQPVRPPLRVDTIWYLNYYLKPLGSWGDRPEQGPWRVFVRPDRNPAGNSLISVPQNVQAPLLLGQAWDAEGPLPVLRIMGTTQEPEETQGSTPGPVENNRPMQLALRNAYVGGGDAAKGLRLELLDLAAPEGMQTAVVTLNPPAEILRGRERDFGPGVFERQYTAACEFCVQHVAELNYRNTDVSSPSLELRGYPAAWGPNVPDRPFASDLRMALEGRALDIFPPPSQPPGWKGTAPAEQIKHTPSNTYNTRFGVQVFPVPTGNPATTTIELDGQAELDAMELACRGVGLTKSPLERGCGDPIAISRFEDTKQVGQQLECLGNQMKIRAATSVYWLPERAIEYLRNGERVYDASGGALHVAISDLRSSLLQAALSYPVIGGTLERFGSDMRALHARLTRNGLAKEINKVQLRASIAQQATNCLASVGSAFSLENPAGGLASAAATCLNTIAQIGFAAEIKNLEDDVFEAESQEALAEFSGRATDYVTTLSAESIRLSQALEGIQRNLEIIEGLKTDGLRALQTAAWHLSGQSINQAPITWTISNLSYGKYIRYQRALDNAKKMAFFAKRAIEMRLGMSLADMAQDLPLVPAPATWEGSVCQATGIDYGKIADPQGQLAFADAFIGDYVTKLEQVIESYRLVNNFHEGRDTVVVSLRDDIHNTRAECGTESRNLLYWASDLNASEVFRPDEKPLGWAKTGCVMESAEDELGPFERVADHCIIVLPKQESPFFDPIVGVLPVRAWDLGFGAPEWCGPYCAYQAGAAISQTLDLQPGRYRFSWYTPGVEGSGGTLAGRVRRANGTELPLVADPEGGPERGFVEGLDGDWNRAFFEFDVFTEETIQVGFERPSPSDYFVSIAAPLLEKLEDPQHLRTLREPPPFTDTTDERTSFLPVCEDTTGTNFRARNWHRHCQKLCPDGYASNCTEQARTECYWETSFHVSQRSIEAGHMFNQSGFARGNYNYRLQSLGVNFVGTNLRACDGSTLPSACNAAGFIPYSVIHDGPYYVRNHKGQDYRAALFPGRIEHARGLGVERYISNPLGEADRSLIEPYMRSELMGRPLDGEFIIRVWDEDGVNFDAIEDVQLVIDYGYWTRFN